jgi:uncharacterized membrane protein YhaH (DUF805 family)
MKRGGNEVMIEALFEFRGHLGRLAYLGWTIAAIGLVAVASVAAAVLSVPLMMVFAPLRLLVVLPVVIFSVWCSLALMTRRIRDTGLPPLPVIGAVVFVQLADVLVITGLTDMRFFPPFQQSTPLGGFVTVVFGIFLLLWPSEDLPPAGAPPEERDTPDPYGRTSRRGFGHRLP